MSAVENNLVKKEAEIVCRSSAHCCAVVASLTCHQSSSCSRLFMHFIPVHRTCKREKEDYQNIIHFIYLNLFIHLSNYKIGDVMNLRFSIIDQNERKRKQLQSGKHENNFFYILTNCILLLKFKMQCNALIIYRNIKVKRMRRYFMGLSLMMMMIVSPRSWCTVVVALKVVRHLISPHSSPVRYHLIHIHTL